MVFSILLDFLVWNTTGCDMQLCSSVENLVLHVHMHNMESSSQLLTLCNGDVEFLYTFTQCNYCDLDGNKLYA